jgi:rod shape determining protein RodA
VTSISFGQAQGALRGRTAVRGWDRYDYLLIIAALALVGMGLALIFSATRATYDGPIGTLANPVTKQAIFAIIGIIAMVAVSRIDYHWLTHVAWLAYIASVALLIAVLVFGSSTGGSTRWFDLGIVQLQPSEFAKLAMILVLARLFDNSVRDPRDTKTFLVSLAAVVPLAGLIFIEPDLGTAVMFGAIWLGVVVVARVRTNLIIMLLGIGLALAPFLFTFAIADYQVSRIATLVDPWEDAQGEGYNNIQSQIAIGSGQLTGKGLTNGEQTQLSFLRVPTSDFIFSVLGEELGFVGAMALFALLILLLMRGIRAAQIASDTQGQLIAAGIVVMIMSQAFINIAVNVSLFPVTGIPLPFVSQGGSSLVAMFTAIGILQSIVIRHRIYRQV